MVRNRLAVSLLTGLLLVGGGCASTQPSVPAQNTPANTNTSDSASANLTVPSLKMTDHTLYKDDTFRIDRVVATEAGWVAVLNEINARPMEIIGFAPVKKGLNENLRIKIKRDDATAQQYVFLLTDAGWIGEFDNDLEQEEYATDADGKKIVYKFLAELEK